jgi:hypothetical protein
MDAKHLGRTGVSTVARVWKDDASLAARRNMRHQADCGMRGYHEDRTVAGAPLFPRFDERFGVLVGDSPHGVGPPHGPLY